MLQRDELTWYLCISSEALDMYRAIFLNIVAKEFHNDAEAMRLLAVKFISHLFI